MDIRQLETFIQVCDLRSFSRAADRLYITQPTVTSHIQSLEKELGTLLINRIGKTLTLTDSGQILYKYAKEILNTIETATHTLAEHENRIEGHLNILSSSIPCSYYLPEKISEFLKEYQNVSFSISGIDSMNVIHNIKNGQFDFGIVGFFNEDPSLVYHEIFSDEIVFVTHRSVFPQLRDFDVVSLSEVRQLPLVLREQGSGTLRSVQAVLDTIDPSFFKRDFSSIDSNLAILKIIAHGYGASFISSRMALESSSDVLKLRIADVPLYRSFYLVFHKNKQLSPLASTFIRFLLHGADPNAPQEIKRE